MAWMKPTQPSRDPKLGIAGISLCFLPVFWPVHTFAAEEVPPPYVMSKANGVVIGVTWEPAAVRSALPDGVVPVEDMAGGIVIYQTGEAYGLGAYSSAYFYVSVEGFDGSDGNKGSWMLQGVYGPGGRVASALAKYYSLPVRTGSARIDESGGGRRYTGMLGNDVLVSAEIKSGRCEPAAAFEQYPAYDRAKNQIVVLPIPEVGQWCQAEVKALDVRPPAADAFAAFKVRSVTWAGEFRDWSFSFAEPRIVERR
jgi:hypothetical protein